MAPVTRARDGRSGRPEKKTRSGRNKRRAVNGASSSSASTAVPKFDKGRWTKEEKDLLAKGLRLYGFRQYKSLSMVVGTRSPTQIASFLQRELKLFKARNKGKPKTRAEEWMERIDNEAAAGTAIADDGTKLHVTLLVISIVGDFPTPEASGGFNYKSFFQWLASMARGGPPLELDSTTRAYVEQFLMNKGKEKRPNLHRST